MDEDISALLGRYERLLSELHLALDDIEGRKADALRIEEIHGFLQRFGDLGEFVAYINGIKDSIYILKESLTSKEAAKYLGISLSCNVNLTGNHKFDLSIGLSVNLGKVGFRSQVNTPQVGLFSARTYRKTYTQSQSVSWEDKNASLKIENDVSISANAKQSTYPVNDYSGLNSLRARLAEAKNNKTNNNANNQTDSSDTASRQCSCGGDCKCGVDGDACADNGCAANGDGQSASSGQQQDIDFTKPYYCYFRINTHRLTDESQLASLGTLVEYAKANGMTIRVTGAADSATGTAAVNQRLSEERADYIAEQLIALGMDSGQVQTNSLGGIAEYNPIAKNRMVKIELLPSST